MKGRDSMKYLYKITVVIDDDKVLRFQQHDLNAIYQTVRDAFKDCNFKEVSDTDKELVFVIEEGKDSFSEVGIVANSLYDSWLAKYLKKWNGMMQAITVQKIFSKKSKISIPNMVNNHGR